MKGSFYFIAGIILLYLAAVFLGFAFTFEWITSPPQALFSLDYGIYVIVIGFLGIFSWILFQGRSAFKENSFGRHVISLVAVLCAALSGVSLGVLWVIKVVKEETYWSSSFYQQDLSFFVFIIIMLTVLGSTCLAVYKAKN